MMVTRTRGHAYTMFLSLTLKMVLCLFKAWSEYSIFNYSEYLFFHKIPLRNNMGMGRRGVFRGCIDVKFKFQYPLTNIFINLPVLKNRLNS